MQRQATKSRELGGQVIRTEPFRSTASYLQVPNLRTCKVALLLHHEEEPGVYTGDIPLYSQPLSERKGPCYFPTVFPQPPKGKGLEYRDSGMDLGPQVNVC